MNIIVRANPKKFEEVNEMCEALLEIMADKINEKEHIAEQHGLERGRSEGQLIEREHNIKIFILDYLCENFSKEKILQKIELNFQLNAEQAEEYFQKYGGEEFPSTKALG